MKREKVETLDERDIITGLIVSERFCREVVPVLKPRYLQLDYAQTVAHWIIGYYREYKKAPGQDIRRLYTANRETIRDTDLQETILDYIGKLSRDWEKSSQLNEPFAIKRALEYIDRRSLQVLMDDVALNVQMGDVKKARSLLVESNTIAGTDTGEIDILNDTELVVDAFVKEDDVMFQFPGALGRVAGAFRREDFVAFTAPMKRGKTWWLMYTALAAMYKGYKVLFFTLEMSGAQMVRRTWQSIYGQSPEDVKAKMPYFEDVETEDRTGVVVRHRTVHRKAIDASAVRKRQKAQKQVVRGGGLKIVALPAYTKNVIDIEEMVSSYAYGLTKDGKPFQADVIVVDYADILAPCGSYKGEYRHNLDETWKRLRGLAQSRKCLVVTASQAGRETFKGKVRAENVSEDIRKLAHVTSMMGLNQTEQEGQRGIMRVNQLAIREGKKEYRQAVVLQCLALGKPYVDSRFETEVIKEDDDETEGRRIKQSRKSRR